MPSIGAGIAQGLNQVGGQMQDLAITQQNMDLNKQKQALLSQTAQQNKAVFDAGAAGREKEAALDADFVANFKKDQQRRATPIDMNKLPKDNYVLNATIEAAKSSGHLRPDKVPTQGDYEDFQKYGKEHPEVFMAPFTKAYQEVTQKINSEMPAIQASQKKLQELQEELKSPETDIAKKEKLTKQIQDIQGQIQEANKTMQPLQMQSQQILKALSMGDKQIESMQQFQNFENSGEYQNLDAKGKQLYNMAKAGGNFEFFTKGVEKMNEEKAKREEMLDAQREKLKAEGAVKTEIAELNASARKEVAAMIHSMKGSGGEKAANIETFQRDDGSVVLLNKITGEVKETSLKNVKKPGVDKPTKTGGGLRDNLKASAPTGKDVDGKPYWTWKDGTNHYSPEK